jgi:hypothetical protein
MKTSMTFTSQDIKAAEDHNTKMYARRGIVKNTRSGNAHVKGYLGELLFENYCKAIGWQYEKAPEDTGDTGDTYDFIVKANGREVNIDVKASCFPFLILDEYQASKATKNACTLVYVLISKDLREGTMLGWCNPVFQDLPSDHFFWKKWPKTKWKCIPESSMKLFDKAYIL